MYECVCLCVHVYALPKWMCEGQKVRGLPVEVNFFFPPCGWLGLISGLQSCQQATLLAGPSSKPKNFYSYISVQNTEDNKTWYAIIISCRKKTMFAIAAGKQKYPGRHHKRKEHIGSSFRYNQCLLMIIHFYAKQIEDQASLFWGNPIHEWAVMVRSTIQLWTEESPLTLLNHPRNHMSCWILKTEVGWNSTSYLWERVDLETHIKGMWVSKKLLRVRCVRYQLVSTRWVRWP